MQLNQRNKVIIESICVLGGLGLAILYPFFSLILGFYVIYKIALFLPVKNFGIITRFAISTLLIICANSLLGFFAWVFKIKVGNNLLIILYSLIVIGLLVISSRTVSRNSKKYIFIKIEEVFALTIALSIFIFTLFPLIPNHSAIIATRIITSGGDNLSHLELLHAVNKEGGYVQGTSSDLRHELTAVLIPYPQGWHINLSILKNGIETVSGRFPLERFLYFYYIACCANLAILTYLFIVLGLTVSESLKRTYKFANYLSVGLFTALLMTGPFFDFFMFGFQTQIAALGLFLGEILLLLSLHNTKETRSRKILLFLSLIIAGGISYIWLFLWPIALAAIFLVVHDIYRPKIKDLILNWRLVVLSCLVGSFGLGQVLFQVLFTGGGSNINAPGHILEPNNLLLTILLLVVYIFVLYSYKIKEIRILGQITGAAAVFSMLVLVFQLLTVDEPRYFYYKSTYTFIILSFILLACALSIVISTSVKKIGNSRFNFVILAILMVIASINLAWTTSSKGFRLYEQGKPYGMSEELADAVISIVKADPKYGHRLIAIGSCNREQDIKAMRLAVALTGDPDIEQKDIVNSQSSSSSRLKTFNAIKKQLDTEPGLFVISTDYPTQNKLIEYLGDDVNKIKFVDLDYGRAEKTPILCPNLLR